MDNICIDCVRGRRSRRRRGHSRAMPVPYLNRNHPYTKRCSFLSSLSSFLILSSLMALIYLMLEYHCTTCASKCNMSSISTNIDNIAKNISTINKNYQDLELKMTKFTQQLPKIEGQIEVLEALANSMESGDMLWNPKQHLTPPNVDVYLSRNEQGRNVSQKCSKRFVKSATVGCNSRTCLANKTSS